MRKILLFLLLLTLSLPLFAQKKREADVVGHVINKATREHLSYINNIMIKGASIRTITDAKGHYFLKGLPENEYILIASAIGYKTVEQQSQCTTPQKMLRSPDRYVYLTAYFGIIKDMNLSVSGIYTGSMLVQHFAGYIPEDSEIETPDFLDLNIKLSYDFQLTDTTLQLYEGVQNIFNSFQSDFDRCPLRDAGYIYGTALPHTFFMGMMIKI
ncbi:MAG: TonB-dependent receptor [Bacteroidales bacterium]|nr:TonB-dependent receptor [Bacteroidales bacterium]